MTAQRRDNKYSFLVIVVVRRFFLKIFSIRVHLVFYMCDGIINILVGIPAREWSEQSVIMGTEFRFNFLYDLLQMDFRETCPCELDRMILSVD